MIMMTIIMLADLTQAEERLNLSSNMPKVLRKGNKKNIHLAYSF